MTVFFLSEQHQTVKEDEFNFFRRSPPASGLYHRIVHGKSLRKRGGETIYSSDKGTHEEHVRLILEKLRKFKLFANLKKCFFDLDEVDYIGYLVNTMGVKMDPARVQTINTWPEPKSFKDIQIFVGFEPDHILDTKDFILCVVYDEAAGERSLKSLGNKPVALQTKEICQSLSDSEVVDGSINARNEPTNNDEIESIASSARTLITRGRTRPSFGLKDAFSVTRRKALKKRSRGRPPKSKKLPEESNKSFRLEAKEHVVPFEAIN